MRFATLLLTAVLLAGCDSGPTFLEASENVRIEQAELDELRRELEEFKNKTSAAEQYEFDTEEKYRDTFSKREQAIKLMESNIQDQSAIVERYESVRDSLRP